MGRDSLLNFKTWKNWQEILQLANLIVTDRPSYPNDLTSIADIPKTLININPLPISGTKIRDLIKTGKNVEDLLPKKVWSYIIENYLYR
jgi:nicotinate-nucleotide adenylyltransferase